MKQSLLLMISVFILGNYSWAQSSDDCTINPLITSNSRSFKIVGADSYAYTDSLFAKFPKTKRRGYVWKFKKVKIPGVSERVTLQVHQGIQGVIETKGDSSVCTSGGSYFHTFTSEKYKKTLLDKQKDHEHPAITIYVKRGRKYGTMSADEAEIVKTYLRTIFEV